jgi:hypothetical protein
MRFTATAPAAFKFFDPGRKTTLQHNLTGGGHRTRRVAAPLLSLPPKPSRISSSTSSKQSISVTVTPAGPSSGTLSRARRLTALRRFAAANHSTCLLRFSCLSLKVEGHLASILGG